MILSFDIGIKNMAYCLMNDEGIIIKLGILDISNNKNKLDDVGNILIEKLNELIIEIEEYNRNDLLEVLIENQPSLLNPVMKSIQMIVYSYFLIRNVDGIIKNKIELVSPSRKLIYMKENNDINLIFEKTYKNNKKNSIDFVMNYLNKNELNKKWIDYLKIIKKKDDISDTIIQALTKVKL